MLDILRANKSVMSLIRNQVESGKKCVGDLSAVDIADIAEECCKALSEKNLAEIIIENIDSMNFHTLIAELLRAPDKLHTDCAQIQIKCEAHKFVSSYFNDAIDELIKEELATLRHSNIRLNHIWDLVADKNPLKLIYSASTPI